MEIVIDYGYIVLFGVAFPFSPLIAIFLSVVELKVDLWKLCRLTRRPFPAKDGSIGIWMKVTQAMAVAGIVTNVGVLIFTTDVFDFEGVEDKWFAFFIIEHSLLLLKVSLSVSIPDRPQHMEDGLKWSNRIANEINKKSTSNEAPHFEPIREGDMEDGLKRSNRMPNEEINNRFTSKKPTFEPIPEADVITLESILI